MTEVLLTHSYYQRLDPKPWSAKQPYPPLGTLYAAAYLRQRGHSVTVFDSMLAAGPEEWKKSLARHRPRYAVLYEDSFNYLSKMCLLRMRDAAFEMIAAARSQGCTVIVHGSDVSDHIREYLAKGAHYVLKGEGEFILGQLLTTLDQSEDGAFDIPGVICHKNASLEPSRAPSVENPDLIPFPARDLIDMEQYRDLWIKHHGYFSTNLVTSRGCPYGCNWCAKPIFGRRYQARSPENVIAEMISLRDEYSPDHLWFADDIFGLKRGWVERFSTLANSQSLEIPFKCLLRADGVDESLASALKKAGCRTVWIGAESGSQRVLDAMDKGIAVEDTRNAARILQSLGIDVGFFLQFGYPGEQWEDIRQTIRLVRECMPDDIGISVAYPLPGTTFYERIQEQLRERHNWLDSNDLLMLFEGEFEPEFYRILHRVIHREYRARKAWKGLRNSNWSNLPALVRAVTLPVDRFRLYRLRQRPGK